MALLWRFDLSERNDEDNRWSRTDHGVGESYEEEWREEKGWSSDLITYFGTFLTFVVLEIRGV